MAASPPAWTKELDLQLIQVIQGAIGADVYDAEKTKLDWQKIYKASSTWPEGFTRDTLKNRWADSYRRWAVSHSPRNLGNRAKVVHFADLRNYLEERASGMVNLVSCGRI